MTICDINTCKRPLPKLADRHAGVFLGKHYIFCKQCFSCLVEFVKRRFSSDEDMIHPVELVTLGDLGYSSLAQVNPPITSVTHNGGHYVYPPVNSSNSSYDLFITDSNGNIVPLK